MVLNHLQQLRLHLLWSQPRPAVHSAVHFLPVLPWVLYQLSCRPLKSRAENLVLLRLLDYFPTNIAQRIVGALWVSVARGGTLSSAGVPLNDEMNVGNG
jgi:hypothetical protein